MHSRKKGCTDHGVGFALIIANAVSGQKSDRIYAQYQHMSEIDSTLLKQITANCSHETDPRYGYSRDDYYCQSETAVPINSKEVIGKTGASGYGCNELIKADSDACFKAKRQIPYGFHLHLEAKYFADLDPSKEKTAFGYSNCIPHRLKYVDPVVFLDGPDKIIGKHPVHIAPDGNGVNMRVGPLQEYTAALTATGGQPLYATQKLDASTPNCSDGWYRLSIKYQENKGKSCKVFKADPSSYFPATLKLSGYLPHVWMCRGNNGVKYIADD